MRRRGDRQRRGSAGIEARKRRRRRADAGRENHSLHAKRPSAIAPASGCRQDCPRLVVPLGPVARIATILWGPPSSFCPRSPATGSPPRSNRKAGETGGSQRRCASEQRGNFEHEGRPFSSCSSCPSRSTKDRPSSTWAMQLELDNIDLLLGEGSFAVSEVIVPHPYESLVET